MQKLDIIATNIELTDKHEHYHDHDHDHDNEHDHHINCFYISLNNVYTFSNLTNIEISFRIENVIIFEYLENCVFLTSLDIKNNNMEIVDTSRWNFKFLQKICISSCDLKNIPKFILNSKEIEKIICKNNYIRSIPRCFLLLSNLRILDLIDNDIIEYLLPPFQYNKYYLGLQPVISDYVRNKKLIILLKNEDIINIHNMNYEIF